MKPSKQIEILWQQACAAIDKAYSEHGHDDEFNGLRDYTHNWNRRDLERLFDAELANERQHRSGTRYGIDGHTRAPAISARIATKLILLDNFVAGAEKQNPPSPSLFLVIRHEAWHALLIGWLVREYLSPEFRAAVKSLDYAQLMKG